MSKLYLKDKRYSKRGRRTPVVGKGQGGKRILLVFTIILLLALLTLFSSYLVKNKIKKSFENFVKHYDNHDYSQAVKTYRSTKEGLLNVSFYKPMKDLRDEQVNLMEDHILEVSKNIFHEVAFEGMPLSQESINFEQEFMEISYKEFKDIFESYVFDLIRDDYGYDQIRNVLDEYKRVDNFKVYLSEVENSLEDIIDYSLNYKDLRDLLDREDYLAFIKYIYADLNVAHGLIEDFIDKFLVENLDEVYGSLSDQVEDLLYKDKYYSASLLLDDLLVYFPDDENFKAKYSKAIGMVPQEIVEYTAGIEHISIRPLISEKNFDFARDAFSLTAEDLMLTTDEFSRMLDELYKNSYVLIDIESIISSRGKLLPVHIPEGKKPLILSIEGLNYYASRRLSGNSLNLELDEDNNVVARYMDSDGRYTLGWEGEAVGILDDFISRYPDFSFDGARGNISLTGFEGIFGYITDIDQVDDRQRAYEEYQLGYFDISNQEIRENRQRVIDLAKVMKDKGWTFSYSTYGNIDVGNSSLESLKSDLTKWRAQVEELVGEVTVVIFPFGSVVSSRDEKGRYLIEQGFKIHCGIGPDAYYNQGESHLFMDRVCINGQTLRGLDLSRFFDVSKIYDKSRSKRLSR